ncbi:MAG: potassium transporter TrkG [Trueperaceae bacterium]
MAGGSPGERHVPRRRRHRTNDICRLRDVSHPGRRADRGLDANRRTFVDDAQIRRVVSFVVLYLSAYAFGVLVLSASGFDLEASLFEFASAIGTVVLSVGVTSAQMPDPALWAVIGAMFFGRLEFVVVIVSVIKLLADGRSMLVRKLPSGRRGRD